MKKVLVLCGVLLGSPPPTSVAAPEDSVVKVFATVRYPNPLKPWTTGTPTDVIGSGTIIEGRRTRPTTGARSWRTRKSPRRTPGNDARCIQG